MCVKINRLGENNDLQKQGTLYVLYMVHYLILLKYFAV